MREAEALVRPEAEGVVVRPIRAGDIPDALDVIRAAHAQAGTLSDRYAPVPLRRQLLAGAIRVTEGAPLFLVASWGATPVAGVLGLARSFCSAVGWELGFLAVHPACQGRGIARHLVTRALEGARAEGGAFVLARAYHPPLFESLGFRRFDDGRPALMGADLGTGPR